MKSEDCIFFQLSRVSRAGARYWHKKVAPFGVTSAQALVMMLLSEQDGITSRDLGEKVEFDSATLTGLIDRLVRAGMIERQSNPDDRRAILVYLTETGQKTAGQLHSMVGGDNQAFLSDLTEEEGMILKSLLKKIR
mgnify:CR=1 FL=1